MSKKAVARTSGTVQKLLSSNFDGVSEKAEITVKGCDELYRELRIENALKNADGDNVRLKEGAEVELTIAANQDDTLPVTTNGAVGHLKKLVRKILPN
jgi:hypothetical protein